MFTMEPVYFVFESSLGRRQLVFAGSNTGAVSCCKSLSRLCRIGNHPHVVKWNIYRAWLNTIFESADFLKVRSFTYTPSHVSK